VQKVPFNQLTVAEVRKAVSIAAGQGRILSPDEQGQIESKPLKRGHTVEMRFTPKQATDLMVAASARGLTPYDLICELLQQNGIIGE
jgi:hypothetical protein